jgi:dienelactone hydrolase
VNNQARDDSFVLDALARLNGDAASPWYRALDFSRVGAFGHSFGGGASVQAAFLDPRIRAAVNMDGWMFGDLWRQNFSRPLLLIYSEQFPPSPEVMQAGLKSSDRNKRLVTQLDLADLANVNRTLSTCGGYVAAIRGAKHFNFSDRALYSPFRRLTEAGSIVPGRAYRIIDEYTLAFFNEALNQTPAPLLHNAAPYPEVQFESRARQAGCEATPAPAASGAVTPSNAD